MVCVTHMLLALFVMATDIGMFNVLIRQFSVELTMVWQSLEAISGSWYGRIITVATTSPEARNYY